VAAAEPVHEPDAAGREQTCRYARVCQQCTGQGRPAAPMCPAAVLTGVGAVAGVSGPASACRSTPHVTAVGRHRGRPVETSGPGRRGRLSSRALVALVAQPLGLGPGRVNDGRARLHIISERDVGLFSLVQQVLAHIPWAAAEGRIPVVYFGEGTCYWTPAGYRGSDTVWEYYFEPLHTGFPAAAIPERIKSVISSNRLSPFEVGYLAGEDVFVSCHFGDHPLLRQLTLRIPYEWDDPSDSLRRRAKEVLDKFVKPRPYVVEKVEDFFNSHLAGQYVIGVHARGTDATSMQEIRGFRRGSLVLSRYTAEIERLLEDEPEARIFVASDEESSLRYLAATFPGRVVSYDTVRHVEGEPAGQGPTGWIMPAYIAADREVAAKNGEDAVIEYLLLSQCDYLVHNGSSLARTVLLNAPDLSHTNTHRKPTLDVEQMVSLNSNDASSVGES
jgi:hypothetical protein